VAKRAIFYSYRGGTGRTTILANVAVALARMGERVCILDCDFGAPGLARWRDLRPDLADFSPTFTDSLLQAMESSSTVQIRPYRISVVTGESESESSVRTRVEPGSLWFLPPGPLNSRIKDAWQQPRNASRYPVDGDARSLDDGEASGTDSLADALAQIIDLVEDQVRPTVLIVDSSPGVASGIESVVAGVGEVDLVVFPTRLTLQAVEGFNVASAISALIGDTRRILPVATFVPPGVEITADFQRKMRGVERKLNGARVEHLVPLIPELGVSERILTASWPEDLPASIPFWRIAEGIAQRLDLATGLEVTARTLEDEFAFDDAQHLYRESYSRNTAHATALLGAARCMLRSQSEPHGQSRADAALELVAAFFTARGLPRVEAGDLHQFALDVIAEARADVDALARMRFSRRFSAILGRIDRSLEKRPTSDTTNVSSNRTIAVETLATLGLRTALELVDAILPLASTIVSTAATQSSHQSSADTAGRSFLRLYPTDGQYGEWSVGDALRANELIAVLPESSAKAEKTVTELQVAIGATVDRGHESCDFRPRVVSLTEITAGSLSGLRAMELGGAARTLFIVPVDELSDAVLETAVRRTASLLAARPRCRVLLVPRRLGRNHNRLHEWQRVAQFAVAPPSDVSSWLRHTMGASSLGTDQYAQDPQPRGQLASAITILIEDQGPGRAFRDLLEERPTSSVRGEVWLTKLPAILDVIDQYEHHIAELRPPLPGYDTQREDVKRLDVLCMYQPRLASLQRAANAAGGTARPLRVLSLLTGYLVYRRDFFENTEYRETYYRVWQDGEPSPRRLTVPRTFDDVVEKAAFFDYALQSSGRGLALQHSLRDGCAPDEQPADALMALWHEWSMISRLLVGHHIRRSVLDDSNLASRLDEADGDLFGEAARRFAALSTFADPESWSYSWDAARQRLIDGGVAMTITWSDSVPLLTDLLDRRGMLPQFAFTLINLDSDDREVAHVPLAHVDGLMAILLAPEKAGGAGTLFGSFDDDAIREDFMSRGGSPPEFVAAALSGARSVPDRFLLDACATRYGVPRAHNPSLDQNTILSQARLLAQRLYVTRSKRKTVVSHISEFRHQYHSITDDLANN